MSDLGTRLEKVSFILNELRDDSNYELITLCVGEIGDIQRRIQQQKLSTCFEAQENQLLEYYEKKYSEAEKIILNLEKEIEELKHHHEKPIYQNESPNVLVERSIFWKDSTNIQTTRFENSPPKEHFSLDKMTNLLNEMEIKSLHNERESRHDKNQIKLLESLNEQYVHQIKSLSEQLDELTMNIQNKEALNLQLNEEKANLNQEAYQLKEELRFFKTKVEGLEKDVENKDSNVSILEVKMRILEEKISNLDVTVIEILKENQNLKTELKEYKEKLNHASEERQEELNFQKSDSDQKEILNVGNNIPVRVQNLRTTKTFSTPHTKVDLKQNNDLNGLQFDYEDNRVEVLPFSTEDLHEKNEQSVILLNDYCRHELSEKAKSIFSPISEYNFSCQKLKSPIPERTSAYLKNSSRSTARINSARSSVIKNDKLLGCASLRCSIF